MSARSEIALHSTDGNIDVGMTLMLTLEKFQLDRIGFVGSHYI